MFTLSVCSLRQSGFAGYESQEAIDCCLRCELQTCVEDHILKHHGRRRGDRASRASSFAQPGESECSDDGRSDSIIHTRLTP